MVWRTEYLLKPALIKCSCGRTFRRDRVGQRCPECDRDPDDYLRELMFGPRI